MRGNVNYRLTGRSNRLKVCKFPICQRSTVAVILACLIPAFSGCNRASDAAPESAEPRVQRVTVPERKPTLPPCPNAPYPVLQATALGVGHHKVFLKWNASASASPTDPNLLGYCLYRTQTDGSTKRCPNHSDCEQVTPVPVLTTRCVDDLVKDRTKYRYVAIAINDRGQTSSPTNAAIAKIPTAGQRNPAPPDAASYPACRTPASPSQPPPR
jgi:hypothetical protein